MKRTSIGLGFILIVCLLALSISRPPLVTASGDDTNWPQWRGPGGSGISTEKNLPTEWSETKNVQWKTAIPGRGHSSPIIWGKRIFLTTSIEGPIVPGAKAVTHIRHGDDYRHPDSVGGDHSYTIKVLCLDRETGKILWERTAYEGTVSDDRHRKNTFASATPVTDGKYVWTLFDAEGMYCYDFDGNLVWKISLGKFAKMGMGNGMSPVLYENLVILQCDQEDGGPGSFIAALDKLTGKEVWRTLRTQRKTWATPVLVHTQQRSRVLTKEELMREVWVDCFVGTHNLPVSIHTLRKALDEGRNAHSHIETVPRRGYRFITEVREAWGEPADLVTREGSESNSVADNRNKETKMKAVFKTAWPYAADAMNLPVENVEAAIPFYEKIMGFQLVTRNDSPWKSVVLARDGIQIGLAENGGDPTQEGCFFEVDNVEAAFDELKSNGLGREEAGFSIDQHGATSFKVFFIVAPDGLCYCLGERQS